MSVEKQSIKTKKSPRMHQVVPVNGHRKKCTTLDFWQVVPKTATPQGGRDIDFQPNKTTVQQHNPSVARAASSKSFPRRDMFGSGCTGMSAPWQDLRELRKPHFSCPNEAK